MQVVIDSIKHYILSREFNTRKVTVERNSSATEDYPEGLLLAVDTSNDKMKVAENADTAVCALLNRIPMATIKANDVKAEVVYISGLAKPKIVDSNEPLQITQKFIEKAGKNGLDIMKTLPDKKVNVVSLAITGSFTNTQYTGRPVDPTGLTFKATYSDGDVETVVASAVSNWGDTAGADKVMTFSYTEDGITVTATKTATLVLDVPQSLAITGDWTETQYTGEAVDATGLVFKATYLSTYVDVVTDDVTVSPATWGETAGEQTATFSFTDGETTVTATKDATVVANAPVSLAVGGDWENVQVVSTAVDPTGLVIMATLTNGDEVDVTDDATFTPATWGETEGEQTATFSYTAYEVTVTATKTAAVVSAG